MDFGSQIRLLDSTNEAATQIDQYQCEPRLKRQDRLGIRTSHPTSISILYLSMNQEYELVESCTGQSKHGPRSGFKCVFGIDSPHVFFILCLPSNSTPSLNIRVHLLAPKHQPRSYTGEWIPVLLTSVENSFEHELISVDTALSSS